jgi:PAS domain-containing protein
MMAFSAYPKFLTSKYHSPPCIGSSGTKGFRETDVAQGIKGEATLVENSIQTKMSIELDKMLAGTSWLSGLLSSIESLPVCVSLAAASRTMRGFPLVYVNAAFETTTGYDRSEILGQVRQLVIGLVCCLQ